LQADDREWDLLRLLPSFVLTVFGWTVLLSSGGLALLLVTVAFVMPHVVVTLQRWRPDRLGLGPVPDTVEQLSPTNLVTTVDVLGRLEGRLDQDAGHTVTVGEYRAALLRCDAWSGPRTLLPDLDDGELMHAWECSTRALSLRPEPAVLLRIATARGRYLDAMAERDPTTVSRLLARSEQDDWTAPTD